MKSMTFDISPFTLAAAGIKAIIEKSRSEVSLMEQDTIENVS